MRVLIRWVCGPHPTPSGHLPHVVEHWSYWRAKVVLLATCVSHAQQCAYAASVWHSLQQMQHMTVAASHFAWHPLEVLMAHPVPLAPKFATSAGMCPWSGPAALSRYTDALCCLQGIFVDPDGNIIEGPNMNMGIVTHDDEVVVSKHK